MTKPFRAQQDFDSIRILTSNPAPPPNDGERHQTHASQWQQSAVSEDSAPSSSRHAFDLHRTRNGLRSVTLASAEPGNLVGGPANGVRLRLGDCSYAGWLQESPTPARASRAEAPAALARALGMAVLAMYM